MVSRQAGAPLPEMGLTMARGMHSSGKPRKLVTGRSRLAIISAAPDEVNVPTAVISRMSIGISPTAILRFSVAPRRTHSLYPPFSQAHSKV